MQRRLAGPLAVALVSGAYAALLLALEPGYQPAADSHYHFVIGREIAHGHLVPDVARGLPFTVLRDMPVDHYWGYHALLAPFALVPDAELGMKVATVALYAAIFVSLYLFLRARGVLYPWAWAIAPSCFSNQDWRYLQLRGGQLVLPLLVALLEVAFFEARPRRRRILLVVLGYVALLSYHGGVVLLPFHVAGIAALFALRRSDLAPGQIFEPALTAAGMALGLTLNPYMDARASTWRFFALHVGDMGRDTAHLYDDQEVAEFHGFPARVLLQHPEWLVLVIAGLAAVVFVVWRARTDRSSLPKEAIVLAGMTVAGAFLTAQAMRTREYSVPMAFCLFAVLAPRSAPRWKPRAFPWLVAATLGVTLDVHGAATLPMIASHLPTAEYEGALPLLEANGDRPILNMAEADYCMLLWQYDKVVCVQALSRYFIYPYKELFHDVWELHNHGDTSPETPAILRRFWGRGVRIMAVHKTNAMMHYAVEHPKMLHLLFRSKANGACLFGLDPEALGVAAKD
ncbi:MAG TPA: glycosyltransferase 87 family protein [Polyangiaceae bacterium]|jgi:hypothetical protein